LETEKNIKGLTIEFKTAQYDQKVLCQINNVRNRIITDMVFKTYLRQQKHKAAG